MSGTGLGLSTARWIVETGGVTLSVKRVAGCGPRFEVRLPELQKGEREGGSKACCCYPFASDGQTKFSMASKLCDVFLLDVGFVIDSLRQTVRAIE